MKQLHTANLFSWSEFNEERNLDFHSVLWVRDQGNIIFDPLPLTPHNQKHLLSLGKVSSIIISNSDHIRDALNIAALTGAKIVGPAAEKAEFPIECDQWLEGGEDFIADLEVFALDGSKTPGELAFVIEQTTLLTGDLIRCHQGGVLRLLPEPKLTDKAAAIASVKNLLHAIQVTSVLPGDGWPIFGNAEAVINKLLADLDNL